MEGVSLKDSSCPGSLLPLPVFCLPSAAETLLTESFYLSGQHRVRNMESTHHELESPKL